MEWLLILLGGALGSAHCVGMCGGFALSIGMHSRGVAGNLGRQLAYSAGRIATYSFLGMCAGCFGLWLGRRAGTLVDVASWLSIGAGVLLVGQGLRSLGVWPVWGSGVSGGSPCLMSGLFRSFLASPRRGDVFLAGVLTGFLPCGLVYGYLGLASSRVGLFGGLATMAIFGAGTVPLMVAAGVGASLASVGARRRVLRLAACCVLATGLLAIGRGAAFLRTRSVTLEAPACPACTAGLVAPMRVSVTPPVGPR